MGGIFSMFPIISMVLVIILLQIRYATAFQHIINQYFGGLNSRNTFHHAMGLFKDFKNIAKTSPDSSNIDKQLKKYMETVEKINLLEEFYENLSDEQLQQKTSEFRQRFQKGTKLDELLVEAFAVVREASWRVLELRHFDMQLVGGMTIHDGKIAEMATGEGKTLVAILAAYLNSLSGDNVMLVTTSDYLAKRDGEKMGQVLRFLGRSVGIVQALQSDALRRAAYNCDITYTSNQALGFDYLKDNLILSLDGLVQCKPYSFCIVDEADSILIDEARTPLIISKKGATISSKYTASTKIASSLIAGKHYNVNMKDQRVDLTPDGYKYAEEIVGKGLFELSDPWAFYIINAIKAKDLYKKDQHYIVQNGEIFIIDSFTGRILQGRRFSDGLQQAVESKEAVNISPGAQIIAKISFQNLFKLFPKLSGMTGTGFTDSIEFSDVYGLQVLPIPTSLPVARRDNPDAIFRTKLGKMKALLKNVLTNHEKGRPILIGTTSVESSEEILQALEDLGISAKLLNARPENVESESEIISQAGRVNAITVATNMAGRGTDIVLGGSAKDLVKSILRHLFFLQLGLKKQKAGELVQYSSDKLPSFKDVLRELDISIPTAILDDKFEENLKVVIEECALQMTEYSKIDIDNFISLALDPIQDIPSTENLIMLRSVIGKFSKDLDYALKRERERVLKLGGLYVIGTCRHESRRIDNQLRGRAGRQGDPGASRFFLSLEDDIFKVFGADKMKGLLENFRVAEDIPIESDMVTNALDKVQGQVETYFRSMRMQIYRLDEVMAKQRSAIYENRRSFLYSSDEEVCSTFRAFCFKTLSEIVDASFASAEKNGDSIRVEKLHAKILQFFPNIELSSAELVGLPQSTLLTFLEERLGHAIDNKQKDIDAVGVWAFTAFFRYLALVQIDESWCKHLTRLEMLQEEIVIQSFSAERDVLEIYREKANKLFDSLQDDVRRNSVYSMFIYKNAKN